MNIKRVHKCFSIAKNASLESTFKQHHLGAAIFYKGALLATGHNSNKTNPVQKHYNKLRNFDVNASYAINSLHAECACLNKVRYLEIDFSKVSIFVYREHKNGTKALARPCPACMKYICELGIKNLYYTTENGFAHEVIE